MAASFFLACCGGFGAAGGCYNPKVVSGGLQCGPGNECPDGFACDSTGHCSTARGGVVIGTGGNSEGGAGGEGGGGSGGGGGGSGGGSDNCANPIASLCPDGAGAAGVCDPVCQTGCACGLRCSVASAGDVCITPLGAKMVGDVCQPDADDCEPGLICLQEGCGTNLGRCYRFCRDASVCGANGVCGTPIELPDGTTTSERACNLGDQPCDAVAATGCPDPALNCYVIGPNHTTCDCPSSPTPKQDGEACIDYNDCAPGSACLQVTGSSRCYKVCRNSSDCAGCVALGTAGGYCP